MKPPQQRFCFPCGAALAADVAVPGVCPACGRSLTKGTIWTQPTPSAAWLGFHLTVLLLTHATLWALSTLAYAAAPPDALNGVIFVFAIFLAVPTFALALCIVAIRVTSGSAVRPDSSSRQAIVVGNSIIVGLHALVVLWVLGSSLAA